jgi:hypothetical protein
MCKYPSRPLNYRNHIIVSTVQYNYKVLDKKKYQQLIPILTFRRWTFGRLGGLQLSDDVYFSQRAMFDSGNTPLSTQ